MADGIRFNWARFSKRTGPVEVYCALDYSNAYQNKGEAITDHYRMRHNYGIWQIGIGYPARLPFGVMHMTILAGASRWSVDRMTNINPENAQGSSRVAYCWFPAFSLECDAALLPEGLLVLGNASISIDLLAGVSVFPGDLSKLLKEDLMHSEWDEDNWAFPYVGIGVGFGI